MSKHNKKEFKNEKEDEVLNKDLPKNDKTEINETTNDEEVVIDLVDEKDEKIKKLEAEVADLKNKYAMAYADTENTRKRLQSEADHAKKYRIQSFALEILPVLDNLERALASDENKKDEGFYKGVKMIYDQLVNALKNEGVNEIDCLNKDFDPNFENAIMQEKVEGVDSNKVIEVLQKGYMLKDRVLRAAMVKTSE